MGARHYADIHVNRTDRLLVAPVDARFTLDDALPNDILFELRQGTGQLFGSPAGVIIVASQRFDSGRLDVGNRCLALHLVADLVCLGEAGRRLRLHGARQFVVFFRRLPVPGRLARFRGELVDRVDRRLHLLVTVHHGTEHDLLGQPFRFRFNHQHGIACACNDQFQVRIRQRRCTGVKHVFAVDVADFCGPDRTRERHTRDRQCG